MIEGSRVIRELSKSGTGRMMNGLYMEGPYMRAGSGSFNSQLLWKGDINKTEYNPLLEEFGDMVRVWAIDPARDGIIGFMKDVKANNPNAIFALGHSRATTEECRRVKDLGVKVQTHHGDSGQVKGKAQGTPGAGCDEFTLYDPDMYAELIVDQVGIHVVPDRVKMVIRTKGVERMILISDSMPHDNDYKNNAEAGIEYGPDLNYDDAGCLAGSRLSIDNAVRNVMTHSGYGLCHAVRFASYNPARMLGIADEVGSLEAGKIANVILIDDQVRVKRSFLYGDEIYKA
jgi:N-acetylglucosamine-6-phosphate deacetylase